MLRMGAENAAKQMNARVTQYVPTRPDSIPDQMSQIEDVITRRPDAVVFVPVDFKAMSPGVLKLNAAKIPVVNVKIGRASCRERGVDVGGCGALSMREYT